MAERTPSGPTAQDTDDREAGFEALYERAYEPTVRLAHLLVEPGSTADDAVHDAFAEVHERWDRIDDPVAHLRACVVARGRARERRHRRRRGSPEPAAAYDELDARDLGDALADLPYRRRAAVVLRAHEGLGDADIASALRVAPRTVPSTVRRGLFGLQEAVAPRTRPDDAGLDAVEWRLPSELHALTERVRQPVDGMAAIRGRIARRRRRRRTVVGLAAILVLGILVVAVSDVTRPADEADVVATEGGATPLLGFANDTWRVVGHSPETAYVVVDSTEGPSDEAIALVVARDDTPSQPGGAPTMERAPERTIEHSEGPLQVGSVRWGDGGEDGRGGEGAAVWWSPAPGWTVTLVGNSPAAFDDADALLAAADPVVEVDRESWQGRLGSSLGIGGTPTGERPDD